MTAPENPGRDAELKELREALSKATTEREKYRELYMKLLERCRMLERGIVAGQKAERFTGEDDGQLSMQLLGMLLSGEEPAALGADVDELLADLEDADLDEDEDGVDDPNDPPPRRRRRGRRPLPEELPRVDIEVLPPEVLEEGQAAFRRIGEAVSEVVERRPGSLVVVRVHRPKFARKLDPATETIEAQLAGETSEAPAVVIAEPPERPIERGLAGPSLLASTIVQRWQDHPTTRDRIVKEVAAQLPHASTELVAVMGTVVGAMLEGHPELEVFGESGASGTAPVRPLTRSSKLGPAQTRRATSVRLLRGWR